MLLPSQSVRTRAVGKKKSETTETGLAQRQCSTCLKVKDSKRFHRVPLEPFEFRKDCKDCVRSSAEKPIPEDSGLPHEEQVMAQKKRGDQAMRNAAKGQKAFKDCMRALERAASESGEEAILKTFQSLHEPQFFEERVISFTTLMQTVRGIATCRLRHEPSLLLLPPDLLADRMLELRQAVPFGDIAELTYIAPGLLLLDDIKGRLKGPALRKLHKHMKDMDNEDIQYDNRAIWQASKEMFSGGKVTFN